MTASSTVNRAAPNLGNDHVTAGQPSPAPQSGGLSSLGDPGPWAIGVVQPIFAVLEIFRGNVPIFPLS